MGNQYFHEPDERGKMTRNPKFRNDVDVGLAENGRRNGLGKPMKASKDLQAIIGIEKASRLDVMREVWVYIKKHKLQNPQQKQFIVPDELMAPVFGTKNISIFNLSKFVEPHLKPFTKRDLIDSWK